jgi:hypothetical protein
MVKGSISPSLINNESVVMSAILAAYLTTVFLTQTIGRIKQFLAIALINQKYADVTLILCMKRVTGQINDVVNI